MRIITKKISDTDCNVLVLLNHGQIAVGKNMETALKVAEFFEFACKIACQNMKLRKYDSKAIEQLQSYGQ